MAFTLLDPSSTSKLNRFDIPALSSTHYTDMNLNYTCIPNPNNPEKWIYSNFVEKIEDKKYFGDNNLKDSSNNKIGNVCLNQQKISAGTHQIFFSYGFTKASLPANSYFGIQLYNNGASDVTYTEFNRGYGFNGTGTGQLGPWEAVAGKTVHNFLTNTSQSTRTIKSNKSIWLPEDLYALKSGSNIVSGLIKFSVTGSVIVSTYMYSDISKIDGSATIYPHPLNTSDIAKQYSGIANGIKYKASITLDAKDMPLYEGERDANNNIKKSLRIQTCKASISNLKIDGTSASTDLRPITLANPSSTIISSTSPNQNLGNWGFPYEFDVTLKNTSESTKKICGYVRTDSAGTVKNYELFPVINSGNTTYYTVLQSVTSATVYNSWKFFEKELKKDEMFNSTFTFVNGTNGTASNSLFFRLY